MSNLLSPGHTKIKQQCTNYAGELALENFNASWAEDIITKESILTVEAATGTNEVRFSEQEVEEYDRGLA
jgi:hypothetical protein